MLQASVDDRVKARVAEEKQRKVEEKLKQEEEAKERIENAEKAFKAWKEQKANIIKELKGRLLKL